MKVRRRFSHFQPFQRYQHQEHYHSYGSHDQFLEQNGQLGLHISADCFLHKHTCSTVEDHTNPGWPRDNRIRAGEPREDRIVQPGSIVVQTALEVKLLVGEFVFCRGAAFQFIVPESAEGHMVGKLSVVIAVLVGDNICAAEMVPMKIVDAAGIDFGDPLAGGEKIFYVLPVHPVRRGLFERISDIDGGEIEGEAGFDRFGGYRVIGI